MKSVSSYWFGSEAIEYEPVVFLLENPQPPAYPATV